MRKDHPELIHKRRNPSRATREVFTTAEKTLGRKIGKQKTIRKLLENTEN